MPEETPAAAIATRTFPGADPVIQPWPAHPATERVQRTGDPPEIARYGPGIPATPSADQIARYGPGVPATATADQIVRYGPGVPATPPAGQAELTAEHVWRGSGRGGPSPRRAWLRRVSGAALTGILLAASGFLLYLRFHHAPFEVTGVAITQQTHDGCAVDVTGRITTNGSAGTVSYQWEFQLGQQPPQPMSQSVAAGQHAVYVTVDAEGQGHGTVSEVVALQVLGPEAKAISERVVVSC